MKATFFEQRSLGVNFRPGQEPVARVWAPQAKQISLQLAGEKKIPLQRERYGYWQAACPGLKPGDRYLINIDGENTFPDPASEDTFNRSKLKWDYLEVVSKQCMLAYYKKLIALRKEQPLLKPGKRDHINAFEAADKDAIVLVHENGNERLVALMNFGENNATIEIPALNATAADLLVYSAHKQWGGTVNDHDNILTLEGQEFVATIVRKSFVLFWVN